MPSVRSRDVKFHEVPVNALFVPVDGEPRTYVRTAGGQAVDAHFVAAVAPFGDSEAPAASRSFDREDAVFLVHVE